MHIGQVLGVDTYRDTANLVNGILQRSWQETFTTRDIWVLSFTLVTVLLLIIVQTFYVLTTPRSKLSWLKFFLGIVFDVLVFMILIVLQLRVLNWIIEVRAPRNVRIERVSPELVVVNWKTYDPESSLVYWGYAPDNLQNVTLGVSGSSLSREHEVLLSIETGREVYLRIAVGREKYGINVTRGGEPYGVSGGEQ